MTYSFGPFKLSRIQRTLHRDGNLVPLGSRAFDLLTILVENHGNVVEKRELTARAWPNTIVDEVSLRVHISSLKKALGTSDAGSAYITNVAGRGYMLSADADLGISVGSSDARTETAPTHPLPPPLPRMVGRDDLISEVSSLLAEVRFVTILGAGGMGKTTLAIAAGHTLRPQLHGEVLFIDLTSIEESRLVSTTLASELGLASSSRDSISAICNFLRDKPRLVILDNCEHVIDTIAAVAEALYRECPDIRILATSREALRAQGEYVLKIEPLAVPGLGVTGPEVREAPAVQLFLDRLLAAGGTRDVSEADLAIAVEICRQLDGAALAIELAASRAASHGLTRTAQLLDQRFGIHWSGRRTAMPRHQTMLALHDWSYNLLDDHEKCAFRRLGWIGGTFTAEISAAVAAMEMEDALEALANKSLVQRLSAETGAMRYRLPETTRAYALEKLRAQPEELQSCASRHAEFYADRLEALARQAATFNKTGVLRVHPESLANVRIALAWCFSDLGDLSLGVRLITHASHLFQELSLLEECFRWTSRALDALPEAYQGSPDEAVLQQARAVSGIIVKDAAPIVSSSFQRSLALANEHSNRRLQLCLLAGMNIFTMRSGDCDEGVRIAARAEALCINGADSESLDLVAWMTGIGHAYAGEMMEAKAALERRRCDSDRRGGLNLVMFTQYIRSEVQLARVGYFLDGNGRKAVSISQDAIAAATAYGHPIPLSIALAYSSSTAIWARERGIASAMAEELGAVSGRHSLNAFAAVARGLSGEILLANGSAAEAAERLAASVAEMERLGHHHMLPSFHMALAEAYSGISRHAAARVAVASALETAGRSGERFQMSDFLTAEGLLLCSADASDYSIGRQRLQEALDLARRNGSPLFELRALAALELVDPLAWAEKTIDAAARLPLQETGYHLSQARLSAARMCGLRTVEEMGFVTDRPAFA